MLKLPPQLIREILRAAATGAQSVDPAGEIKVPKSVSAWLAQLVNLNAEDQVRSFFLNELKDHRGNGK